MSSNTPVLPSVFPQDGITVSDEPHRYRVFQTSGAPEPQSEYTLDKAPIQRIKKVTGVSNGQEITFSDGVDYELSADNERIVWKTSASDKPDAGTLFFVTYASESIISRYLAASTLELDTAEEKIDESLTSRFIDQASGNDLDRIGALFGPNIGARDGRGDAQYRFYLKSIVSSFISRGTKNGIKLAIAAAASVDIDDVTIVEFFDTNEYEIVVVPNNAVIGSIIEQVAELADPSGVKLRQTRFRPEPDEVGIQDAVSPREIAEAIAADTVNVFDSAIVDPNKTFVGIDAVSINDSTAATTDDVLVWSQSNWGNVWAGAMADTEERIAIVDDFSTAITDNMVVDDSVSVTEALVAAWGVDNWGTNDWA